MDDANLEIIFVFSMDTLHFYKSDRKDIYVIKVCCCFELSVHQRMYHCFHKMIKQHSFLQHQISILEWFLKNYEIVKTGVMILKIQLWHHRNTFDFEIYKKNELINIAQYYSYTVFLIKWKRRLLLKPLQIYPTPNFKCVWVLDHVLYASVVFAGALLAVAIDCPPVPYSTWATAAEMSMALTNSLP